MPKIKDRLFAGVIAGLGANMIKTSIEHTAQALGLTKETGVKKAAGFFLTPRKVGTPKGKVIGFLGDNTIAASLGIFTSYLFSFSGKDYPVLKGIVIGNFSWSAMYGIMSQFGATKVRSNDPNTYLISMLSHTIFGITQAYLLTKITDPGLFKPHKSLGEPCEDTWENNGENNTKDVE